MVMGKKPHVLAVPLPFQGHAKPLMKFCREIARCGIKVTFVTIQSVLATAKESDGEDNNIVLASIPDCRNAEELNQKDAYMLSDILRKTMPGSLTELIEDINSSNEDEKIGFVIADITIDWVLETAEKMGAKPVLFCPASAACVAIYLHIPELIKQGYVDSNGNITGDDQVIILSENMPPLKTNEFGWHFEQDIETRKMLFDCRRRLVKAVNEAKLLLVNTCCELESAACALNPKFVAIGPLVESSSNSCSFYTEDVSCLTWLDDKPDKSVVYVSFGSLATFSQQQLNELAFGLELSGRDFLWVVRSDLANGLHAGYPDGFLERISERGKIVEWAPQEKVLLHPSVAVFLSHCGWNSVLEGLNVGMPFLCWPYAGDQFHNQDYICNKWEIGLKINPDEHGIRTRDEINKKIEMMFCGENLKKNAMNMKEMALKSVVEGGSSYNNLGKFIDHLKNFIAHM